MLEYVNFLFSTPWVVPVIMGELLWADLTVK